MAGVAIDHKPLDLVEIQSLDLKEIVEYKARQAYETLGKPVVVEDTSFSISSLGRLPGPLIKWFIDEIGLIALCKLDNSPKRTVLVSSVYAYYDGHELTYFEKEIAGTLAEYPKGQEGFGWNPIFIPAGSTKTLAEMSAAEFEEVYVKIKPLKEVGAFLRQLDKQQ